MSLTLWADEAPDLYPPDDGVDRDATVELPCATYGCVLPEHAGEHDLSALAESRVGRRVQTGRSRGTIIAELVETRPVYRDAKPRGYCYRVQWDGPSDDRPGGVTITAATDVELVRE